MSDSDARCGGPHAGCKTVCHSAVRAALEQSFQSVVAAAAQRLQSRSAVDGDRRGRSHVRIGRGVGSEPVKVPSQLVELELLGDGSIDPVHVS